MGLYQVSSNNSPGVKFDPTPGVTSFTWDYIGKTLEVSLYLAIRPRLTKFSCSFIKWASTKSVQGIALILAPPRGLQVLHWLIEGKIRASMESAQIIALGSDLAPPGFTSFTWAYIGKTLEISMYQAIRPRLQILHVALSSEPLPREPKK